MFGERDADLNDMRLATDPVTPAAPRVVRCACEHCGAHTNAIWTFRIGGSCPTCGSFRLLPLQGAELMACPPAA